MIPFFVARVGGRRVESIPAMPFAVELFLDQFHNFFLFGLDPSLFLAESVELRLALGYVLAVEADVGQAGERVFVPDV